MNFYYEKQNDTEEVALRSDIVAKSILKLPRKERSIFVMTYLRNNRLEYICEKLKITREEALILKKKALVDFTDNLAELQRKRVNEEGGDENE